MFEIGIVFSTYIPLFCVSNILWYPFITGITYHKFFDVAINVFCDGETGFERLNQVVECMYIYI